jgi:broad specificity phosphatase PhoE
MGQIEKLLKRLEGERIDAIYSSDLSRSMTTAEALGRAFGRPPIVVAGLREIGFGQWEGLTWAEIESRDQEYARRWLEAFPDLAAPDGETFEAFRSRVLNEVQKLLDTSFQGCAAVVTHAGVMRLVLCSLCSLDEHAAAELTKGYCGSFRYRPGRAWAKGTYTFQGENL